MVIMKKQTKELARNYNTFNPRSIYLVKIEIKWCFGAEYGRSYGGENKKNGTKVIRTMLNELVVNGCSGVHMF